MAKTQRRVEERRDKDLEETRQGNGGEMMVGEDEDEAFVTMMKHRQDCRNSRKLPLSFRDNISA